MADLFTLHVEPDHACTRGNTALALYEAHGFAEILNSLTVEL